MKLRTLALAALLFAGLPLASSSAFIGISVGFAPPPLPVYVQPPCPVEGYLWTPGYWAYGDVGYYWVPGVWVPPPRVGVYWTPGYWGYSGGSYVFNAGYWGPTVGFYGGINYGFGYGGIGYGGGEWAGDRFRYNTAVTRVNTNIVHNTYINKTVVNNYGKRGASFNGPGGVNRQPTAQERAAASAEHVAATPEQAKVEQAAAKNPALNAKNNHGHPKVAALKTPDEINNQPATAAGTGAAGNGAKKGAKAQNNGAGAQQTAAGTTAAGAGQKPAKKAVHAQNNGAARQQGNAAKARRERANSNVMPATAAQPRIPQAAQRHGHATEAIAARGPQHRTQAAAFHPNNAGRVQATSAARGQQGPVHVDKRKRANAKQVGQ